VVLEVAFLHEMVWEEGVCLVVLVVYFSVGVQWVVLESVPLVEALTRRTFGYL
jgi:hypothetical protein